MIINPYNFRHYLSRPNIEPHLSAWVLCALVFAFLVYWSAPYIAPESVALKLPRSAPMSLKNPPSAFVVVTGNEFIYQNKLYNLGSLAAQLQALPEKKVLLLAASSNTSLQELLGILNRLEQLGFEQVNFTVKP